MTVLTTSAVVQDGHSNWLKGMTLLLAYCIVAGAFYHHKDAPTDSINEADTLPKWSTSPHHKLAAHKMIPHNDSDTEPPIESPLANITDYRKFLAPVINVSSPFDINDALKEYLKPVNGTL
eukprot:825037-Pyramimonas_sp.AAC.1